MLSRYFLPPVALVELNFQESAKPEVNNAAVISLSCCSWYNIIQIQYNEAFIHLGAESQPALLSGWIRNVYSCSNEKSDLLSVNEVTQEKRSLQVEPLLQPQGLTSTQVRWSSLLPYTEGPAWTSTGERCLGSMHRVEESLTAGGLSSPMAVDLQSPWLMRGVGCCHIPRAVKLLLLSLQWGRISPLLCIKPNPNSWACIQGRDWGWLIPKRILPGVSKGSGLQGVMTNLGNSSLCFGRKVCLGIGWVGFFMVLFITFQLYSVFSDGIFATSCFWIVTIIFSANRTGSNWVLGQLLPLKQKKTLQEGFSRAL